MAAIYWELDIEARTDKSKCLAMLIKAVQLDTNNADAFAALGCYYELARDVPRAIKCYQKSFLIVPANDVGRELGRLYEQSG